ncbi:glutaminase [Arcobacter sp. F2176]|uniref:glutaminase n=1 Tax=unclassified Arcobacter TaxID=2593671 RepID=UPI00100C23C8|nr:glutaminase [Arcobacter sp. F2176]RXJ78289.1 glutaminase [Arcobacter sp. F2176]|eukprot:TRINITY_DN3706_c0_g1_i4.p1 TRINITY_DN3706_c0_g1~~TRINITY_DN3706_c0_g1_i4.p1  ORF type:complete len:306 (+),score=-24.91 TRINITY_DN3706_c0_g1_i4:844-1761(+)
MNLNTTLQEIQEEIQKYSTKGKLANYIPMLAQADENDFAMSIITLEGEEFHIGCSDKKFSIQSISKVFTFTLALEHYSKQLYKRVGHEPSGDPFNSLVQLEYESGIPRNPFINAGAIVTTDCLTSIFNNNAFDEILTFMKKVSHEENITYDKDIFISELGHGFQNFALINLMKSYQNIKNPIDDVIQTYFKQCSIMMNTKQLAHSMLFLANHGEDPFTKEQIINESKAKRINSLMLTCGHYDASGDFAYKVGLPGKSGVGGGIVAVVPKKMAICVYSPKLNVHGNSLIGTKALELFTTKTGLSIF